MSSLFEPLALWARVRAELARPQRAAWRLLTLALLGALGPACAVALGSTLLSTHWDGELGFVPAAAGRIDPFRGTFVGLLVAPAALAAMFMLLGRLYRLRDCTLLAACAVAVVGALPVYVAGLTMVFMPAILLVIAAFLLSCFWWAVGARTVLGVTEGDAAEFNAIAIIGSVVLMQFAGSVLSGVVSS